MSNRLVGFSGQHQANRNYRARRHFLVIQISLFVDQAVLIAGPNISGEVDLPAENRGETMKHLIAETVSLTAFVE